jgi:hypothetical protein
MVTESHQSARLDVTQEPLAVTFSSPGSSQGSSPGSSPGDRPVERYGAPRPWARPVTIAVVALLVLVGGGWLAWAALFHAQPDVSARLRAFEVLGDRVVSATIDVEREPGLAAVCLLEAQASDHFVVGERRIRIPPGPEEALTLTYRIETERPATNAVLDGCTASGAGPEAGRLGMAPGFAPLLGLFLSPDGFA